MLDCNTAGCCLRIRAAFSHLVPIYVWICFGTVFFFTLLAAAYDKKNKTGNNCKPLINPSSEIPDNLQALKKLTEQPPYQRFKPFNEAYEKIKPVIDGKTSWLLLTGPAGAGKTATANAIISELELEKAVSSGAGAAPIRTAFRLKTRGAGGVRMVAARSLGQGIEASKDARRLLTGKDGILVYEKWFQHVAPK